MIRKIRLRIELQILKLKVKYYEKRYKAFRKKTFELEGKYKTASTSFYYAVQNIYPQKAWDMRAEREYQKSNF